MLTTVELTSMRSTQASTMQDIVDIEHITLTYDSYGAPVASGVVESGIQCGFWFTDGSQKDKGADSIVEYDAELRIPLTQSIGINDEITLVEKMGVTHNEVFRVWEYPRFGASAQTVFLKRKNN